MHQSRHLAFGSCTKVEGSIRINLSSKFKGVHTLMDNRFELVIIKVSLIPHSRFFLLQLMPQMGALPTMSKRNEKKVRNSNTQKI